MVAIENVRDADRCSDGPSRGFRANEFPAGKFDARAFVFRFVARFEQQPRNCGDRRQSFAAKAQGSDGKQVVGGFELAGGMALERQQRIVVGHPVTVVGHADHALPALLDLDARAVRARIERVFEQLLHY